MSLDTIANRYASALTDVIIERGEVNEVTTELERFATLIQAHIELRNVFASPVLAVERKQAVLGELLSRLKLRQTTSNFLRLLLENQRLHYLDQMLSGLRRELDARREIVSAQVTTARPVGDHERDLLRDRLRVAVGKEVRLQFRTDPAIIGGVVARIGSKIYDGSIKNQLAQVKKQLAQAK